MGELANIEQARSAKFAVDIVQSFAAGGAMVTRADEIGDPELWRATARRIVRGHEKVNRL
jgi:hypothetical protein